MKQEITKLFSPVAWKRYLIATAILAGCLTMRASDREFGVPYFIGSLIGVNLLALPTVVIGAKRPV